jgi:hypothetical protein
MIIPTKSELQKHQSTESILRAALLSVLLVCSLVSLPSLSSKADGTGVNSNTTTSGTTSSSVDGNPTSTTINNDDGSQTTTTVTPVTTTTTETTVTQTNRDAELTSLQSQMKTSAGRATFDGWTLNSFGSSIGASPTEGLMTGANANVTTTITNDQLFGDDVNSTEAGQGFSFSYGANVDNNQGEGDAWQITLNIFNSANTQLGTSTISGNSFHGSTTMTGLLDVNAGNIVDYATLNLIGTGAGTGGFLTGARFNDMFTSFLYNEIESSISTATTYETLVATVSCDILNTCVVADTTSEDIATGALGISSDTSVADTAITAPAEIAEIAQLPSGGSDTGTTTATINAEPVAPSIASLDIEAAPEAAAEVAAEKSVEADMEAEVDNNQSQPTENQPEADEQAAEGSNSNTNDNKSGSKSASVRSESDDKSEEGDAESAKSNSVNKKPTTKAEKRKAKQKAAQKIVKKMGDKGRYSNASQITTLVVMQVLGNTKDFFSSQQKLQDTPNFFTNATIPDNSISDNNYTSYFLFGGADQAHNALTESQYRR